MTLKHLTTACTIILLLAAPVFGQRKPADRIVAVVNGHIVLKSEVDAQVRMVLQQQKMPFSKELWYDVMESMIDNFVLVEKAKIDSVIITDAEVDRSLQQRIDAQIQEFGSEDAMIEAYGKSVPQLKAEYRDRFKLEMTAQRVRQKKMDEIKITRPEVKAFLDRIPRDSLPTIPESVELAQIVVVAPPAADAKQKAFELANILRDSILTHGKTIEELADRHGLSPAGKNGGYLPLMPLSDLVPEYSAAASALEPGGISQVVETQFGFHVIRLNKRIADKIETNHILIPVNRDVVDEEYAIQKLTSIRDSITTHKKSFFDMAKRHSEDKFTAQMGGRMLDMQTGSRLLALTQMDPTLYRVVLLMENPGDISEPKAFNLEGPIVKKAFRIIKLIKRVDEHRANIEQDYELLQQYALQQKQVMELQKWLKKLRENDIYVEIKVPKPTS
jgi:peptidyl-prolyl cis-trans isomerase SurA